MRWKKLGLLVPAPVGPAWAASHASVPIAQRLDRASYRIFFSARDSEGHSCLGATVVDIEKATVLERAKDVPLLTAGPQGTFDDAGVMGCWLVERDAADWIYYVGWNRGVSVPFRNAIGLAAAAKGSDQFVRLCAGPVLDRSPSDPCFVASPCVLVEAGCWRMWYVSCVKWEPRADGLRHYYHLRYARSADGIDWEAQRPIAVDFKDADEYAIARPSVLSRNGRYQMWFCCRGPAYRLGYAESDDGLDWERNDACAGLDVSAAGWDSEMIAYPYVFDHDGTLFMLYNGNGYGRTGIGLAVAEGEG